MRIIKKFVIDWLIAIDCTILLLMIDFRWIDWKILLLIIGWLIERFYCWCDWFTCIFIYWLIDWLIDWTRWLLIWWLIDTLCSHMPAYKLSGRSVVKMHVLILINKPRLKSQFCVLFLYCIMLFCFSWHTPNPSQAWPH